MEILAASAATVRFPAYGEDPVAFTKTPEVIVVSDRSGEALGEPEVEVVGTEGAPDYWQIALEGKDIADPDLLTLTWSDGDSTFTQLVEVVGGFACSLNEIAEWQGEDPDPLAVEAKREIATREIESACGVAFRPRYFHETVNGRGSERIMLRQRELREVLELEVGETLLSESEVAELAIDPIGKIYGRIFPSGIDNVTVRYVAGFHGLAEAREPICALAAHLLTPRPSDWQGRATSFTNEFGSTYTLVTPGVRGASFPIPSVNAFVSRFAMPLVG